MGGYSPLKAAIRASNPSAAQGICRSAGSSMCSPATTEASIFSSIPSNTNKYWRQNPHTHHFKKPNTDTRATREPCKGATHARRFGDWAKSSDNLGFSSLAHAACNFVGAVFAVRPHAVLRERSTWVCLIWSVPYERECSKHRGSVAGSLFGCRLRQLLVSPRRFPF